MRLFDAKVFGPILAAVLTAPVIAEPSDEYYEKACDAAETLSLTGPSTQAANLYLTCAKNPKASPFEIAQARIERLNMLEQLRFREQAEAELVALTSPPIAQYPVFTNVPSGMIKIEGMVSVGFTQVDLLAARAGYRLMAEDPAGARSFADQAIAAAGSEPDLLFDAAPAHAVRARLLYADKQIDKAVGQAVRAYLRGTGDEFVLELVKQMPQETQTELARLRQAFHDQAGGYAYANSPQGRVTQKGEDLEKILTRARMVAAELLAFEKAQLGPDG